MLSFSGIEIDEIIFQPDKIAPQLGDISEAERSLIEREKSVSLNDKLNAIAHLVKETHERLKREGSFYFQDPKDHFLRIRPACQARALRILNALIRAFSDIGLKIGINVTNNKSFYYVAAFGEQLKFTFSEKTRQVKHVLTEREKEYQKRDLSSFIPCWDYEPTGELRLTLDAYAPEGLQKIWRDSNTGTVEEKLSYFINAVIIAALYGRKRSLEIKEETDRWEKERKQEEQEEAQRLQLEEYAEQWARYQRLNSLISAVEANLGKGGCSASNQPKLERWLSWANSYIDQLNPLKTILS